ncbi:MAG: sugar ABC transporter permease, partial [Rhodobacter sp.]|nr:sugar ABC transporter permease [Rhodobacter sp.]
MTQALLAFLTIVVGVAGCVGYFWASNLLLDKVLFPARGPNAGQNINRANLLRPWLFLFPAVAALGLYLAYPVFATLWLSLNKNQSGELVFVGLDNYRTMFGEAKFWESLRNNMVWLIVVPAASTAFGLLAAQLTDRIRWGNLAKSMIFMPMAISFVGASVIWKLIYDTREAGQPQIGLLNALWMLADGGFFSILILKVLPVVLLVGIAAGILWFLWAQIRDFADGGIWGKVLRGLGVLVGAWLVFVALSWAWGAATAVLPYGKPQFWLQIPFWNNFFLMAVLIWLQTGFAMVILSAALRGVPEETVEAAILDGANPFQIFFKIKVPQIMGTIVVVWTTI